MPQHPGKIRIIAGSWRGRTIPVVAQSRLRPTTDRVRETLFNWLAPHIVDSMCLDLFAGTGILGLESLSRGAKGCTFIEKSHELTQALSKNVAAFEAATKSNIHNADVIKWLQKDNPEPYDIIFCDPPYGEFAFEHILKLLQQHNFIHKNSVIYHEHSKQQDLFLPDNFTIFKTSSAGNSKFHLIKEAT